MFPLNVSTFPRIKTCILKSIVSKTEVQAIMYFNSSKTRTIPYDMLIKYPTYTGRPSHISKAAN